MEKLVDNSLEFVISVNRAHINHVYELRNWVDLTAFFHENHIWIGNLNADQIQSLAVSSIPFKTIFRVENDFIFNLNHRLPSSKMPDAEWKPLRDLLPIENPSFNHNYFELGQTLELKIVPSNLEQKTTATIIPFKENKEIYFSLPSFRLRNKTYTVLNGKELFVIGAPLLPCEGMSFWQLGNMFIPSGYDFNYRVLSENIYQKLSEDNEKYIVWNIDSSYFEIDKFELRNLSKSSLRLTLQELAR